VPPAHRRLYLEPQVGAQAIRELLSYFREQLAHRRDHPSDVTTLLDNAEVNGEPLDERTRAAMLLLLLIGGIDTTWTALGASLWHLTTHPDDQARLRQQPELVDTALEEFLRFYAPVEIGRIATRDTILSGCPIAAGDQMWLSFPAACRDPAEFPDADQFVIDRQPNRHVAFGAGVHRCLGSNLARMEMKVAIATWLQRVPTFRLREDTTVEWTTSGNVRGPESLLSRSDTPRRPHSPEHRARGVNGSGSSSDSNRHPRRQPRRCPNITPATASRRVRYRRFTGDPPWVCRDRLRPNGYVTNRWPLTTIVELEATRMAESGKRAVGDDPHGRRIAIDIDGGHLRAHGASRSPAGRARRPPPTPASQGLGRGAVALTAHQHRGSRSGGRRESPPDHG
jgi:hypothetical protein